VYPLYVFREIVRRKSRTAEIVITVGVLIALLISVSAIMDSYSSAVYAPFQSVGADLILQKSETGTAPSSAVIRSPFGKALFSDQELQSISSLGHIKNISESLIVWSFRKDGFSTVEGIDPVSPLGKKLKSWTSTGSFIDSNQSGSVILESHYAKFNHKSVGDMVDIGGESFKIVGILKVLEGSQIFSSNMYLMLPDAQRISHISGINQVYIGLDDVANEGSAHTAIRKVDNKIIVYSGSNLASSLENVATIFEQFYLVIIGLVLIISFLVLGKMSLMGLIERQKEIGVLQTVGWCRRDILVQLTAELGVKVIIGCTLGVVVSYLFIFLAGAVSVQVHPTTLGDPIVISIPLVISPIIVSVYVLLVFIISLLTSYMLGMRIAAKKPDENLRSL
jgi:ABC-type antimicrobial peptide transport system permease subunit